MEKAEKTAWKKIILAGGIFLNLSVLFYFKYIKLAANLLAQLLQKVHIQLSIPAFDILLPVGISFYTFQALGYMVDVFRGETYAERNFFQYALFVSFFRSWWRGPIERSRNLLKQLASPGKFQMEAAVDGLLLMLWGYFLKIVFADRISVFVDTVYGDYMTYGAGTGASLTGRLRCLQAACLIFTGCRNAHC